MCATHLLARCVVIGPAAVARARAALAHTGLTSGMFRPGTFEHRFITDWIAEAPVSSLEC
jgi:hypothetical protein